MSYYDTSYPPSLYGLPSAHDLMLVGNHVPATLTVNFTWDSDGHSATLQYGDGQSVTNTTGTASHTYGANAIYTATVTSGNASDSAVLDLSVSDEPADDEPTDDEPPTTFTAVPVDEIPSD